MYEELIKLDAYLVGSFEDIQEIMI